ncbi:hypothetical protein DES53_11332 [Roseimicrobium gellanilyticum]|uniref:Uncharacterized protein n=1 Tax=Roseimicrobium gellanilyticum TaxID=748857 RepID=A0A366H6A9_9BACT|nr:hypothetical protein [Roseimicrobium gellanilyticum]RBP37650.1 hypothetical protein DES53_11332 [Roseimicrobium gellanilyticum]
MTRRHFLGTTAGAVGAVFGDGYAAEAEFLMLLGVSRPAPEKRFFHFTFVQSPPGVKGPGEKARVPLKSVVRAESVQQVDENGNEAVLKLVNSEHLTLSGGTAEGLQFTTAKETTMVSPRPAMKAGSFNGLPYGACRMDWNALDGIRCLVSFEKPVALPVMLIDRSGKGDVVYFAESAVVPDDTRQMVRLGGIVLSCREDGPSVTGSVDVPVTTSGIMMTRDSKGRLQSLQEVGASELIRHIKAEGSK